jgi:hypothetical protein
VTQSPPNQQALDIGRRLAQQLDTPQAQRDLSWTLSKLGDVTRDLGNTESAAALRAELATVSDQLAALSDDSPDPPPGRS